MDCKLLGLRFDTCDNFLISFSFENCILNYASFYKLKIKETKFKNCEIKEVEFVEADLTSSLFDNCNFDRVVFDRTKLEKSDFRTSYNYSIDPEENNIKKAKFSSSGLSGLLDKYNIIVD